MAPKVTITPATVGETPLPKERTMTGGAFEGASRTARQLALWNPSTGSADWDILSEKETLDVRSRDLIRNDGYAAGASQVVKDNVVGSLYALSAKPKTKLLGFDETWEEEFTEEVEARFTLWAESLDCWVDASRHNTFTDLVRLATSMYVLSGETLATVEYLRDWGRPFSTAIQMIDTDRLSNPPHLHYTFNETVRGGVERNKFGAPIAYHIREAHPSDWHTQKNLKFKRVLARKFWGRLQVIHLFEQQRPDQTRGVSPLAATLKQMRMTEKFEDINLQQAIINATFAAAIESDMPSADLFASMGATDNPTEQVSNWINNYLTNIGVWQGGGRSMHLDGAKIPHLYPGTKLNLIQAGKGGPVGENFHKALLRHTAAGLGISYEQFTRDYSETNYSSVRAALAEVSRRMAVVKRQTADAFAGHIYRLWLEEAINNRRLESMPRAARRDGWLYSDRQRLDMISNAKWIGASKGQIDELKETQAAVLRLRSNLTTEEDEVARLGKDWRDVKRQRAREIAEDQRLNLGQDPAVTDTMNALGAEPGEGGGAEGGSQ